MEFHNSNFEANFDFVKHLIDKCSFFSIDTELTGLHEGSVNFYDTHEMRYKFLRDNSMQYTITQMGICFFTYCTEKKRFQYHPINFQLRPFSYEMGKGDFNLNPQTIEFLNKNNFDYNRCFRDGIPFLSLSDYERKKELIEYEKKGNLSRLSIDIDPAKYYHLIDLINRCEKFLENDSEQEFTIDIPSKSFDRHLILNELWKRVGCINGKYISPIQEKDETTSKTIIKIKKSDNKRLEIEQEITEKYSNRQANAETPAKFSKLMKYLCDSKKVVVIHNGLLDLMHFYDKFLEPLPNEYETFKGKINELFPKIFDTRYMFTDEKFKEMRTFNLESLYALTKSEPFVSPDLLLDSLGEEYNFSENQSFHNAHYDAMITGKVFISLATNLNNNDVEFWNRETFDIPPVLTKHLNRVKIVQADIISLNLNPGSSENECVRNRVFVMTIPTDWDKHDIIVYLAKTLKKSEEMLYEDLEIKWLNCSSVCIKIPTSIDFNEVPTESVDQESPVKIVPFYKYLQVQDTESDQIDEEGFVLKKRRRRH